MVKEIEVIYYDEKGTETGRVPYYPAHKGVVRIGEEIASLARRQLLPKQPGKLDMILVKTQEGDYIVETRNFQIGTP